MLKIALLDDYAKVALKSADWSVLKGKAEITVFDRHLSEDEAALQLKPFDVLCTIRERMSLPRSLFERLHNLKLVTIIGMSLPNLDMAAATENGVIVAHSNFANPIFANIMNATPELTWGLMIATVRHIGVETRRMREGGWQSTVGTILAGRTLALLGLGRIGKRMAAYGRAFGMQVIAWSQNLTDETAASVGARRVEKDDLFRQADVLSIHVVLSDRTRGLVTARELAMMKPEAFLINTSRGPIVVEADLIAALHDGRIAGAGIDVFDVEPPPAHHLPHPGQRRRHAASRLCHTRDADRVLHRHTGCGGCVRQWRANPRGESSCARASQTAKHAMTQSRFDFSSIPSLASG